MPKKIPLRQCLGCREMKPKRELIRVVRSPQGEISLDFHGKKPGRGAYLCPDPACLKRIRKSRALERAFDLPIPDAVYDALAAGDGRRWSGWIVFLPCWALRCEAGRLAVGEEPGGRRLPVPQGVRCCCWPATRRTTPSVGPFISAKPEKPSVSPLPLTKEELGSGLGRTSCAMVAVTDVGFAASIAERLAQDNQETYGEAWQTLAQKAARVKQRRDAKRSPNKNKGKRRKA